MPWQKCEISTGAALFTFARKVEVLDATPGVLLVTVLVVRECMLLFVFTIICEISAPRCSLRRLSKCRVIERAYAMRHFLDPLFSIVVHAVGKHARVYGT